MSTDKTTNQAEESARQLLEGLFRQVFGKVSVLTNLIFPTGPGAAVKSAEIDAVVVCNAGVFVFEVKGWTSCTVLREKNSAGESVWSLSSGGYSKPVRDPLQQIGGKLKVITPVIQEALLNHLAAHTSELAHTVDALSSEKLGERLTQGVKDVVAKINQPNIRARSYVLLPMRGVELAMNVPPTVVCRPELALLVRQLVHETKKDKGFHIVFTDAMVERVALALQTAGSVITQREHLDNVNAVHGDREKETATAQHQEAVS